LRRLGVLAFASLAACASDSNAPIKLTHDACAPLALVSTSASQAQLEGMDAGQSLWRDHGAPSIGLRAGATVEVRFETAAPPFHGLYDDNEGVIYINNDLQEPQTLAIVIAHEVGHSFGLLHVPADEHPSVMNPGNLTTTPNAEDQAALARLWGPCEAPTGP
jgi:hypothetical protein